MTSFAWALIGPGRIAHKFADAVQRSPGMHLAHVQGRDAGRAAAFAAQWTRDGRPAPTHGCDLAALLADPAVDGIYIATPHGQHAELIEACLHAGKPVLCEKSMVASAAQAERVVALARQRRVFLMEAMWTRFLPLYEAMRPWLADAEQGIGPVRAVQASFGFTPAYDPGSRLWDPAAAGGALLDIGVYTLTAARWALEPAPGQAPALSHSHVTGLLAPNGVDLRVSALLAFEGGATAQFVCGLDLVGENAVHILGARGNLSIHSPFWGATQATLRRPHDSGLPDEHLERPFEINGFEYQIREAVRCIRAGLGECPAMPLGESLALAQWLDQARRSVGVHYPFD
ncbi:MAG: Gfo/Idh/MocA family oxidoreductase [Burkholderiaceae bacterium]|nr:Gfo/Idh/MocA family oxidoreductase [Burkholderiaceae bacterium]